MHHFIKKNLYGLVLSILIGVLAVYLSFYVPFLGAIMIAVIIGIFVNNFIKIPDNFNEGISFSSTKILELSIILLAFNISLSKITSIGTVGLIIVISVILITLLSSFFLVKKFTPNNSFGYLIGFGTAICGSSAIVSLAPSISAKKEDIVISIAVVNLLGTLGMLVFPFVLPYFELGNFKTGLLIGGSLHSVGNVTGAGFGVSSQVGEIALTIKLTRIALLSPALLFFSFIISRKNKLSQTKKTKRIPYYLWIFILIIIANSFVDIPLNILNSIKVLSGFLLAISMGAIGLKINFVSFLKKGKQAILFGILIFVILTITLILLSFLFIK